MIQLLEHFLFEIGNALYLPVIVALAGLVIYVLLTLGALAHEAWERRRSSRAVALYLAQLHIELAARAPHLDARLERLLQRAELAVSASLDRIRFVIRAGPALGLMGTLIPMGVSLAALADGDIPQMASSMVMAFTATVVGLGCGVIAYLTALVREKWLYADICEMEYQTEIASRSLQDVAKEELSCAT
ncbi:MotA/TolQ/ExbB proton channel family protein [Castellaniella sp.]|uniref:MotA/TolQ/ExbB proton channel family protein n=1 Tax=Castellaniella sp. TaxID=1955812 RepID=UPI00355D0A7B